MRLISMFFLSAVMVFSSGCVSMFYASTQMTVPKEEVLEKINNPVVVKIEREDNMWGGAIPFVVYDGPKEIGQLGPAGSFEWKREAGYLNLKITGATRLIVGPNLPEESVYEDYLLTGSTFKFISGLNVDGKIAIWIKPLQERAPEDFVAFGRAENANTINTYGEFMKTYAKSSMVDNAIRRCDKIFEDSGMLNIENLNKNIDKISEHNIDYLQSQLSKIFHTHENISRTEMHELLNIENLHNKNIKMMKAYLNALPKGKHAQYAEEVDQYYEAERRPNKKAFEDYLQKWPNSQFERWAKANLAFVSLGEATDQSLINTQERARQIAQSGFKKMLLYMQKTKKNVTSYMLEPENTGYATDSLPKSTDIKILPASGLAFVHANNRYFMQLNALADIEGLVAQFGGTLNYQKISPPSCYYIGTATVDGFKNRFFLKIHVLDGRQIDLSGLLEGSWISIKNKEYYYDGKNWIHGLDNPYFTIEKRMLD